MAASSCLRVSSSVAALSHKPRKGLQRPAVFDFRTSCPRLKLVGTRRLNAKVLCSAMSVDTVIDAMQPLYVKALAALPPPAADVVKSVLGEQFNMWGVLLAFVAAFLSFMVSANILKGKKQNLPPSIPGGLPFLGNMLQLTEKKPHKTFTKWAEKHGPLFHVKTGTINNVVINSADLAKEVMVTNFDSVSTRRMSTAMWILTGGKNMVAMSDYGETHRMLKKIVVSNLLGVNCQRANRFIRGNALNAMIDGIFAELNDKEGVVDVRRCIIYALFPFSMEQVFGYVPEKLFVPELGELSKWDIFDILVIHPLKSVTEVDWRNFFPTLSWIPNSKLQARIQNTHDRKLMVVDALIQEQRKQLQSRAPGRCYADIVLTEHTHLTPIQLQHTIWEPIIESADTTLVTTEWAMYEIAKDPKMQERLYTEISSVVGDRMVIEEDLPNLPLLEAIVKETLRYYAPITILPPRYVSEDIKVGGYDIPRDWDVLINIYGINWDPRVWENPEVWNPDRCLGDKKLDLGIKDFRILSFGGGKRMCAGMTQAFNIIPMNIAALVQHFDFFLPPEENLNAPDTAYLTSHKLYPLKALARPRVTQRLSTKPYSRSTSENISPEGCPVQAK